MEQPLHDHTHGRGKVIFGLTMAIVLGSVSQLLWKYAATDVPAGATAFDTLTVTFSRPSFWAAAGLYVWQFFNWMMVLKYADLSYAQPITAGTYVVVGAAAWALFGEVMPVHRMVGTGLILAGVVLISQSPHRSVPRRHEELVGAGAREDRG